MSSIARVHDANTIERFEAKVDRSGGPDACHLWIGGIDAYGYGRLRPRLQNQRGAHRVAYEIEHGPIPDGLEVRHLCDARYAAGDHTGRRCVNPRHLCLGTHAENMQDMARSGRGSRLARNGEANPRAKLSDAQVSELRERRQRGEMLRYLAREFGITEHSAWKIANGWSRRAG